MGGDNAPTETVAGAVEAAERGVEVVLVGNNAVLESELAKHSRRLPIVGAPEVIEMSDDPARALREKPGASISVAAMQRAVGCCRRETTRLAPPTNAGLAYPRRPSLRSGQSNDARRHCERR